MYLKRERKTELENKVSLTLAPWNLDVLYLNSRELLQCSQSKGVDTRNYVTVLHMTEGPSHSVLLAWFLDFF